MIEANSGTHSLTAGIINCGQTIIKEEGVRSLWKGLTPFATHLTLKYALRMGTNATYQSLLRDEVGTLLLHASLPSGRRFRWGRGEGVPKSPLSFRGVPFADLYLQAYALSMSWVWGSIGVVPGVCVS